MYKALQRHVKHTFAILIEREVNPLPKDKNVRFVHIESICRRKCKYDSRTEVSLENFVGIGEKAGYQDFLLFSLCFLKFFFFSRSLKVGGEGLIRFRVLY